MPVTRQLFDDTHARIGAEETTQLGSVTALEIRRYASAIGEDHPLYNDEEYARRRGYSGIVAPPNMLASIVEWGTGAPEDELLADGTAGDHLLGVEDADVRVMGGGEEMEFHQPVVAGTRVTLQSTLVDVTERETSTGPMIVLGYRNHYRDQAGAPLMTCHRTVLLR